jgi:hypothetical protein
MNYPDAVDAPICGRAALKLSIKTKNRGNLVLSQRLLAVG